MIPDAYDLKRLFARHWRRFWCGEDLRGLIAAPVYRFTDQEAFDSDAVDVAARLISVAPLRLPHREVILEVTDHGPHRRALVAYVWETGGSVEAALLARLRESRQWTDVLVRASFGPNGRAEVVANPCAGLTNEEQAYFQCLTGMVWRALAILAQAGTRIEQTVSKVHRPKLARAGIRGWSWHQIEIAPERLLRRSEPQGGTHASPRWHLRRGHWRQLGDGRRVFVRGCEVGDSERGGILKDYIIEERAA